MVDREGPEAEISWAPNPDIPVPSRVMFEFVATDLGISSSGVKRTECQLDYKHLGEASVSLRRGMGGDGFGNNNGHQQGESWISIGHSSETTGEPV